MERNKAAADKKKAQQDAMLAKSLKEKAEIAAKKKAQKDELANKKKAQQNAMLAKSLKEKAQIAAKKKPLAKDDFSQVQGRRRTTVDLKEAVS